MSRKVKETPKNEDKTISLSQAIKEANEEEIITITYKPESPVTDYPNIITMLNQVITIEDVEWRDTARGRIYYIHTSDGSYYSWSRVLGKQLEEIKKTIEEYKSKGKKVRVKARVLKRKNYLILGEA